MKKRNGFVSNSSSSSFVLTTTEEDFDKAMLKANYRIKSLIEQLKESNLLKKNKMGGVTYIQICDMEDMGGNSYWDGICIEREDGKDEDDDLHYSKNVLEEFQELLGKKYIFYEIG